MSAGSCTGAVREDYADVDCTSLVDTSVVNHAEECVAAGPYSAKVTCTTAAEPELLFPAVVLK